MATTKLSAEDRLDVMELITRYSRCLDTADIEGFLEVWRPDAVLETQGAAARGHDELRAWATRLIETRGVGSTPPTVVHFHGMPLIHGAGDRCTAETYTIIAATSDGDLRISMVGRYFDECVRVDGRWWIQHRTTTTELRGPSAG